MRRPLTDAFEAALGYILMYDDAPLHALSWWSRLWSKTWRRTPPLRPAWEQAYCVECRERAPFRTRGPMTIWCPDCTERRKDFNRRRGYR